MGENTNIFIPRHCFCALQQQWRSIYILHKVAHKNTTGLLISW